MRLAGGESSWGGLLGSRNFESCVAFGGSRPF